VQCSAHPITRSLEAQNDLTVFTVGDRVDTEQVLAQVTSFLTEHPTQFALWILKAGSLEGLVRKDLQNIVDRGRTLGESRRGGRTAIVCATDLDYGLCRMFRTYGEIAQLPFEINVFRTQDEARAWLKHGDLGNA
jgi:hypothetical protein